MSLPIQWLRLRLPRRNLEFAGTKFAVARRLPRYSSKEPVRITAQLPTAIGWRPWRKTKMATSCWDSAFPVLILIPACGTSGASPPIQEERWRVRRRSSPALASRRVHPAAGATMLRSPLIPPTIVLSGSPVSTRRPLAASTGARELLRSSSRAACKLKIVPATDQNAGDGVLVFYCHGSPSIAMLSGAIRERFSARRAGFTSWRGIDEPDQPLCPVPSRWHEWEYPSAGLRLNCPEWAL